MKTLTESIKNINEATDITYNVSMIKPHITISIDVNRLDQKEFEKWLEEQEGKLFWFAEGGNVEY